MVRGISSALSYINALQRADQYQSFNVYNDGGGNFIVTSIGMNAPQQLSPADGTVFNHYPRETTRRWSAGSGSTRYVVQIDCYHCCAAGEWCTDAGRPDYGLNQTAGTQYTFSFVGAQPGRWRVWAINADGQEGPKSDWWEFTYTR
jgi:hypothetical protein